MSDWHQPPEFGADDLGFGIFDRKTLERQGKAAPAAPPGFVPERLKGDQSMQRKRGKVRRGEIAARKSVKAAEMAQREELLREGVLTRKEIAERFGVNPASVSQQATALGIPKVTRVRVPRAEMEAREALIRAGELTYAEIARRFGVCDRTIGQQAQAMGMPPRKIRTRPMRRAKGGRDGRTRTSTEAQGGRRAGGEPGPSEPASGDEAASEAAA